MSKRGGELVASDEPPVVAETLLDGIVMEDGESDGRLANSASTYESKRREVVCQSNDLLGRLVSSKEVPRWWRR